MHNLKKYIPRLNLRQAWLFMGLLMSMLCLGPNVNADDAAALSSLQNWLGISQAAQADFAFGNRGRGRGLIAGRDFAKGEEIMRIPQRYLFTVSKAKQHPKAKLVSKVWDQVHGNSIISWALSWGLDAFWQPYLDLMPNLDDCALLFTQAEREKYIKPLSFYTKYEQWRSGVVADYHRLCAALPAEEREGLPTEETFLRNRALAASRVFSVAAPGKSEAGLVPYVDLLNHDVPENCTWGYNDKEKAFLVTCTKPIKAGEEVLDTYGRKSNVHMWFFYGFTLPTHPNHTVNIPSTRQALTKKMADLAGLIAKARQEQLPAKILPLLSLWEHEHKVLAAAYKKLPLWKKIQPKHCLMLVGFLLLLVLLYWQRRQRSRKRR